MEYPAAQYQGDTGEVSAVHRPATAGPDITYSNGNTCHYIATGESTGGLFGIYRWVMGPQPSGPGPHFHRTITESFFILGSVVNIFDGARWIECVPVDFVHVPFCGIHGFRNETGAHAEMLIHFAPGAPREAYFEGLAEAVASMSPEELYEFYHHHDTHWLD